MIELQIGERVPIEGGGEACVTKRLGEGGQGIVYKVTYGDKEYALKWYFFEKIKNPKKFRDNLLNNINHGAPTSAFIWPQFLTKMYKGSFGYLMDLKPEGYVDCSDYLLAKAHFSNYLTPITAAIQIVNGFRELHRAGFNYQDLNDGNFAIHPQTGDVCILDNDNVSQHGEFSGIAGKMRYMAPEIVCGKAQPNKYTDRFSLAVILFVVLFLGHPLEGAATLVPCMREDYEQKFYGSDPIFCLDPKRGENRPVRGVHTNVINIWPTYPLFVQELFTKAFSKEAIQTPSARILETDWQKALVMLRDRLVTCQCGNMVFLDPGTKNWSCTARRCGRSYNGLKWLDINGYQIPMTPGKHIYRCHLDSGKDDDKIVEGTVVVAPTGQLGLVNLSPAGTTWKVTLNDGSQVAKGVKTGTIIDNIQQVEINDIICTIK